MVAVCITENDHYVYMKFFICSKQTFSTISEPISSKLHSLAMENVPLYILFRGAR